jgi:Flp pilus assembly protein TadB
MILVPLLGAAFGTGLWLAYTALRPARTALVEHLHPHAPAPAPAGRGSAGSGTGSPGGGSWSAALGRHLAPRLAALGLPSARLRADLRALDRPVETLLAEKATSALFGLLVPLLMGFALTTTGTVHSWALPLWACAILAPAAFMVPDHAVRTAAKSHREEVRQALSAVLDITSVALAGGTGITQALQDAADAAHGPAFQLFKQALREAEITRTDPWGPLQALGQRLQLTDLDELAGTIALAGSEGARVKNSLATKAASLRTHLLAEQEALATSATEHMSVPVVLLFVGFLVLIAFPALAKVTGTL